MSSMLTTSGVGVSRAAKMLMASTAYRRFRSKVCRAMRPTLAENTMKMGSSKMTPKARMKIDTKLTNLLIEIPA